MWLSIVDFPTWRCPQTRITGYCWLAFRIVDSMALWKYMVFTSENSKVRLYFARIPKDGKWTVEARREQGIQLPTFCQQLKKPKSQPLLQHLGSIASYIANP